MGEEYLRDRYYVGYVAEFGVGTFLKRYHRQHTYHASLKGEGQVAEFTVSTSGKAKTLDVKGSPRHDLSYDSITLGVAANESKKYGFYDYYILATVNGNRVELIGYTRGAILKTLEPKKWGGTLSRMVKGSKLRPIGELLHYLDIGEDHIKYYQ